MNKQWLQPVALVTLLGVATSVAARDADLEARVARLEQLLQSQGLVQMLTQLEQLQQEVQQLRGEVEVQGHSLEQLKSRQRDLYLDVDRRIQQLEARGAVAAAAPAAAGSAPPASAAPTPAPAAPATSAAASTADPAVIQGEYEKALNILRQGRYTEAAEAYRAFLKQYPQSGYADNAQYWLAETFYVTRQFDKALVEFQKVLDSYPNSTKSADAHLKLGFIHYELAHWDQARGELETVQQQFPNSTAARLAAERLARMQREGH